MCGSRAGSGNVRGSRPGSLRQNHPRRFRGKGRDSGGRTPSSDSNSNNAQRPSFGNVAELTRARAGSPSRPSRRTSSRFARSNLLGVVLLWHPCSSRPPAGPGGALLLTRGAAGACRHLFLGAVAGRPLLPACRELMLSELQKRVASSDATNSCVAADGQPEEHASKSGLLIQLASLKILAITKSWQAGIRSFSDRGDGVKTWSSRSHFAQAPFVSAQGV